MNLGFSVPIAQKTIVPYPHETGRNDMEQEPADELDDRYGHIFPFIAVSIVLLRNFFTAVSVTIQVPPSIGECSVSFQEKVTESSIIETIRLLLMAMRCV
jgi:hypothetical protein